MKIIRYTIFDSLPDGNGADKRTAQITEVLNDAGIDSIIIKKNESIKIPFIQVLYRAIPIFSILIQIIPISCFKNIKSIFKAIRDYIRTEITLLPALQSDATILLWECTRCDNFFVPLIVKKHKKIIIALPHNLESLVPLQRSSISHKKSPGWFNEEIRYLSACDKIFCISKEETLFLKLFNINAFYLPYFPTREIESYFNNIREKRKTKVSTNKKVEKILMIGSANNQPTRLGMIDRIKFFSSTHSNSVNLTIAGFYTQTLSEDITIPDNICVKGSLTLQQLENELLETEAILIHQSASTGALTRISEMLLAGIPIFLNFESARNYYNTEGLYVYENDDHLIELLQSDKTWDIQQPSRPKNEEQIFIKNIKQSI
jgi:hypothetical protein